MAPPYRSPQMVGHGNPIGFVGEKIVSETFVADNFVP